MEEKKKYMQTRVRRQRSRKLLEKKKGTEKENTR